MMPRPYVDSLSMNQESTTLTVVFNESMILYDGWDLERDFNVYIEGAHEPYELTFSIRDSANLEIAGSAIYYFDLNIKDQMLGYQHETVHLQFMNDRYFRAEATTLKLLNFTVSTECFQYASPRPDQCGIAIAHILFWVLFALMTAVVMYYCYNYMNSMTPLWMVVTNLQLLHIYCTMYLYIPT